MPPHLQAPAAINPDLKHVHLLPDEFFEVAVVRFKIVKPLPNALPVRVRIEVCGKWVFVANPLLHVRTHLWLESIYCIKAPEQRRNPPESAQGITRLRGEGPDQPAQ